MSKINEADILIRLALLKSTAESLELKLRRIGIIKGQTNKNHIFQKIDDMHAMCCSLYDSL